MQRVLFIILLLALSACSALPAAPASTPTAAEMTFPSVTLASSLNPSVTPLPTQTPTLVTVYPAPATPAPAYPPSPTPLAPEPTQILFPTPQLAEAAGPIDGPWIVYKISNQPELSLTLVVSDLTGKNRYRIELPALGAVPDSFWNVILPPRGNFIATQWFYPFDRSGPSFEIWLFSLKDGRLVQKIRQFSDEALQEAHKVPPLIPHQRASSFNPTLTALWGELQWSPDGRYLAFSAAFEGTDVNLYLYDTQTERVRQMSFLIHQARFRSWSPDGRYIIYNQEVADDSYPDLGSWLVDVQNGETRYLSRVRVKDSFQWVSSESLLTCELEYESPCLNLRRLDIASGQEKMLYSKSSSGVAADPVFGVIFLLKGLPYFLQAGEMGIYRLFEDGSLVKLTSKAFSDLQWNAALNMFVGTAQTAQANSDVVAFDLYGVEKLRFPGADQIYVSPDGKWIGAAGNLYGADGTLAAHIGDGWSPFYWLPDSTGFFWYTQSDDLSIHRLPDGWLGESINKPPRSGLLGIVQPLVQ